MEYKIKKNKLESFDENSTQVKEILGQAPNWTIRWGTTVVIVIVLLIIVGSALISYNDIVPGKVTITTEVPPAYIKTRTNGKLANIFVEAGQESIKNQLLAEIENTASLNDIYYVKRQLELFKFDIHNIDTLSSIFPISLNLGSVQQSYNHFVSQYQTFLLFNLLEPDKKEISVIKQQKKEQYNLLDKQETQLKLFDEEVNLSQNSYNRNVTLFKQGVIAKAEFEKSHRNYLADKQRYEDLKMAISNTKIAIARLNSSLAQSSIRDTESKHDYSQNLYQSLQILKNDILKWEDLYILKSPIDGKVTLFDVRNKYQNVESGETLFTIIPNNAGAIIGHMVMPVKNSGKVKVNQKVIIKLDNYPYQEWGSLTGNITSISAVPKQGEALYTIHIKMLGLKTSFGKELDFRQEMQGIAEIVTEELTVLQRIFYQLRKAFSRESK